MVAITKELESIFPILYTVLSCCCIVVMETEAKERLLLSNFQIQ